MVESGARKERFSKGEQGQMKAKDEQRWHEVAQEVLLEMRSWREEHPTATLQEIEEEVDARLARRRAGLVEARAMSSAAVEGGGRAASVLSEVGRRAARARPAAAQARDDGPAQGAPRASLWLLSPRSGGIFSPSLRS
jgi:hypothetical protein